MNYKKMIVGLALISTILLVGCSGYDEIKCYDSVRKKYPDSEIVSIPGRSFRLLLKKPNGDILYIETMGITTDITTEFTAFRGKTTEGKNE